MRSAQYLSHRIIHALVVFIASTIDVVKPSAVPGGIFTPIFAHVDVTKIAMMLGLIATHISGAINTITFNKIKNEEKEEKMKKLFFCLILTVFLASSCVKHGPFTVGKPYGGPAPYGDGIHPGIDYDINTGTPIIAAADGRVVHIAVADDGIENGMQVVVTHETHFYTIYAHLSKVAVKNGQLLNRGQLIGLSGASNNYNRKDHQHLHFGVCKFGTPDCRRMVNTIDPKKVWLGGQPQCFDPKMNYSVEDPTGMNKEERDKWQQEDGALWAEMDKYPRGSPERADIMKKILAHAGLRKSLPPFLTIPIACGDYGKALIEESKRKQ